MTIQGEEFGSVLADAPSELLDEYRGYVNVLSNDHTSEDAHKLAIRQVQHSGWYSTEKGWKKLGPDLRGKVAIRKASEQPDGRYFIADVDVFYANDVKGDEDERVFTPERVMRAVLNTNKAIKAGGQAPALSTGHPHPLSKVFGVTPKARGKGVNWRMSPKGEGWARCDLVDVDPKIVSEWKRGEYTGMSAGFVEDANSKNLRFGHVALLGVEMQALSQLPTTEIFQANQLCFSADTQQLSERDSAMKKTTRELIGAMFAANEDVNKALKAIMDGAEGAYQQYEAATASRKAARNAALEYCTGESFEHDDDDDDEDKKIVKDMLEKEEFTASQGPEETGHLPETPNPGPDTGDLNDPVDLPEGGNGGKTYSAKQVKAMINSAVDNATSAQFATFNKRLDSVLSKVTNTLGAMQAKTAAQEFEAFAADLINKGHQFSMEDAKGMFEASGGNDSMLAQVRKLLSATPKTVRQSSLPSMFAGDAGPMALPGENMKAGEVSMDDVLAVVHSATKGRAHFTADDPAVKIADILAG